MWQLSELPVPPTLCRELLSCVPSREFQVRVVPLIRDVIYVLLGYIWTHLLNVNTMYLHPCYLPSYLPPSRMYMWPHTVGCTRTTAAVCVRSVMSSVLVGALVARWDHHGDIPLWKSVNQNWLKSILLVKSLKNFIHSSHTSHLTLIYPTLHPHISHCGTLTPSQGPMHCNSCCNYYTNETEDSGACCNATVGE